VVPLIRYTSNAGLMGDWRVRGVPLVLAWLCATLILVINGTLLWQLAFGE